MSFAFLPLYTGDYRRDTQHLTPARHGIYLLLLMHCWDTKGPAPLDEDELCGITNCRSDDEVASLRYVLQRYFTCMADGWYNQRMQREIERSEQISGKRSAAALVRHGMAAPVELAYGQRIRSARMSDARKRGTHSEEEWNSLVFFHNGQCAKCHSSETVMMKDHIKPLHQGGDDSIENLQPLCYRCNHAKGSDCTDYRLDGWKQHLQANGLHLQACGATPTPTLTPTTTTTTTEEPMVRAARVPGQKKASTKGTRLPEDWRLPDEWLEWALQIRPDWTSQGVVRESITFRDYWLGRSGAGAVKQNWHATWRNWIRRCECEPVR